MALVHTCSASSPMTAIKPPNVIIGHAPECSASKPAITKRSEMANIHLYRSLGVFNDASQNVQEFTRFTTNPIVPIHLIGNKRLNGKKFMEQAFTSRIRKVCMNG